MTSARIVTMSPRHHARLKLKIGISSYGCRQKKGEKCGGGGRGIAAPVISSRRPSSASKFFRTISLPNILAASRHKFGGKKKSINLLRYRMTRVVLKISTAVAPLRCRGLLGLKMSPLICPWPAAINTFND